MTENTFETAVARVLRRHGAAVMDDPIRFRNLLRDYCTSEQCRREINVTILCARSGLLSQICATDTSSPPDVQIGRYAVILHEEYGIDESFGNIFVSTWIKAFDNYRRYIKELSERGILLDNNITSSMINKMGVLYYVGEIVDQDFVEAVTFFEKAAEQSNAEAQFNLGFCYAKGTGCDKDDAVAVKWYRKSAEQGCAVAQCALGLCLLLENGQEIDAEQAVKWFHSAAQQGEPAAQDRLGVIKMALVFLRILLRQPVGFALRPTVVLPKHNFILAYATRMELEFSKMIWRRKNGSKKQRCRVFPRHNACLVYVFWTAAAFLKTSQRH